MIPLLHILEDLAAEGFTGKRKQTLGFIEGLTTVQLDGIGHGPSLAVLSLFAEDVGLLDDTPLINGGLFDSDRALDLTAAEAQALLGAARLNWSKVEPAIFGTLFEHSLDSGTRGKRGAHYTPVQDILDVTVPVVLDPLRAEWDAVKDNVRALLDGKAKDRLQKATAALQAFHERLAGVTVLDPACGSGNFLVVTLGHLLDLESEVIGLAREIGAPFVLFPSRITPEQLRGIEVEPFAHELASVSVWIAFLQWKAAHPSDEWPTPILRNYGSIQHGERAADDDRAGRVRLRGRDQVQPNRVRDGSHASRVRDLLRHPAGRGAGVTDLVAHLPAWLREAVHWQLSRSAEQVLTVEEVALLLGLPAAQVAPHARGGRLLRANVLTLLEAAWAARPSVTRTGTGPLNDGPCGGC